MPPFAKLLKSAGATLSRMQEEMKALQALPADMPPPPPRVPFPAAPSVVQVYHGSPHVWERPAFEANLRRGEGALAYGPGGYTTGNRPLAEHYAKSLAAGKSTAPIGPLGAQHLALQQAFQKDPDAMLAWLTATQFEQADKLGWTKPGKRPVTETATRSMDHSRDNSWKQRHLHELQNVNSAAYQDWLARRADDLGYMPTRINVTQANKDEVVDAGRRLVGGPQPVFGVGKRLQSAPRTDIYDYSRPSWALTPDMQKVYADNALINNFRALAAAEANITGPKFKRGMGSEFGLKFEPGWREQLANWDGKPIRSKDKAPNIYELQLNASPNDMLLLDVPLKDHAPHVQGALQSLAADLKVPWNPEATGDVIAKALPGNAKGMALMREAGIPASAYLRAGPRAFKDPLGSGAFNPDDYNFVIHNEDLLDLLARKDRKAGGAV